MENMQDITDMVLEVLRTNAQSRDDDRLLYLIICKKLNPRACHFEFSDVFVNPEIFGFPNYDSVTRARRKVQKDYPELRGTEYKTRHRYLRWKEMRAYALNEI